MEEFNSWKKISIHLEEVIFFSFSVIHIAAILCQNHLLSEVEKLKGKIHTIMILPHALLQKPALFWYHCAPWVNVYLWHTTIGKATLWKQGVKRVCPSFSSAAQTKGKNVTKSTKKPTFTVWHHRLTTAAKLTSCPMVPAPFSLFLFTVKRQCFIVKQNLGITWGFFVSAIA